MVLWVFPESDRQPFPFMPGFFPRKVFLPVGALSKAFVANLGRIPNCCDISPLAGIPLEAILVRNYPSLQNGAGAPASFLAAGGLLPTITFQA